MAPYRAVNLPADRVRGIMKDMDVLDGRQEGKAPAGMLAVYEKILSAMKDGVNLVDSAGRNFLYTNPAFDRLFGCAPGELAGGPVNALPPPPGKTWEEAVGDIASLLEKTGYWAGRGCNTRKDGSVFWSHVIRLKLDHPGFGTVYLAIHQDITESDLAEEKARENEIIFSSFLEHSPVYIFFKDKDTRAIRLSKNYEKMLGMPADKALGKTMDELFPSDLSKSMMADDRKVLNDNKVITVRENFAGRTYETTKFPIYMNGRPYVLAGFTLDITERKIAEDALRSASGALLEQKAELERKNTALQEVLSQLELEKLRLKEELSAGLDEILTPFLNRMKIRKELRKYAVQVQKRVKDLTSSLRPSAAAERLRKLTLREREICEMVRGGLSSKEISDLLRVSRQTVDAHRRSIRKKLGLTNKGGGLASFLQE